MTMTTEGYIAEGLELLLRVQGAQQVRLGRHPLDYGPVGATEYAHEMQTALIHEAAEFLDEWPWKSWASGAGTIHADEALTELVDVLKFWLNLALVTAGQLELDPRGLAELLVERFKEKTARVDERSARGSDRRSDRCAGGCGRSADDGRLVGRDATYAGSGPSGGAQRQYLCKCGVRNVIGVA